VQPTIAPKVYTNGTVNGTGVNLATAHSWEFQIQVGLWTDGAHVFTLEESEDDSTYTDVAVIDLSGFQLDGLQGLDAGPLNTVTVGDATKDGTVIAVGYIGGAKFLRLKLVTTGATIGATLSANIVLARLRYAGKAAGNATRWDQAN
jgi:hypothetical protein